MEKSWTETMSEMRSRWIADAVQTIADERAFLKSGTSRNVRTLRLMAFRTIRRAQRQLAQAADVLISEAR